MAEHAKAQPSDDKDLVNSFERLRLQHLAFRRTSPEEMRELEATRVEVLKMEATQPTATPDGALAALRLRLYERAFDVLRLGHFANASENRGWINVFRTWGRDAAFNVYFDKYQDTVTRECRHFYELYVKDQKPIDEQPIHHPWAKQPTDTGPGIFMDSGRSTAEMMATRERPGTGAVDSHTDPAGSQYGHETPSGGSGQDDSGSSGTET